MKKLLFFSLLIFLFTQCGDSKQAQLEAAAKVINLSTPQRVDEITVLDSCTALPGRILKYHYSMEMEGLDGLSVPIFELYQKRELVNGMKGGNKDVQKLLDTGVTLIFAYYNEGEEFVTIEVTEADYRGDDNVKNDSTAFKLINKVRTVVADDFPQEMETGMLVDIKAIYPRTLEMNVIDSEFVNDNKFDSLKFKQLRMDEYFGTLDQNMFSDFLGQDANITYRYIFKDENDKYLTTIESTIEDYKQSREIVE